jgi:hypothetical protein
MSVSRFLAIALVGVALVAAFVLIARQIDVVLASTRYNIIAHKAQTNAGSYSFIETSNPSVPVAWSYNRVASTDTVSKFVEVGWIKEDGHPEDPSAFWVSQDGINPSLFGRITSNLGIGTSYNYQVKHHIGDDWDIYFNELNQVDVRKDINTSSLPNVWVGSEVTDLSDNIGDSDDTGSTYRSTSDGNFYQLCNMNQTNDSPANYSIQDLGGCGNWRFYDNP